MPNTISNDSPLVESANSQTSVLRRKWKVVGWGCAATLGLILLTPLWMSLWRRATVPEDAPVIGVSFDRAWHARAGISTKNYELCLTQAGAQILELDANQHDAVQVLDRVNALLLTGGGDVDPELYGGDLASAHLVDRPRDDFEITLIREASGRDMPILGICRGIQILNVAEGGTLQNLRDDPDAAARHGIGLSSFEAHQVTVQPNSTLAIVMGSGEHQVNSFHGQAVDHVADVLRVTALSDDGIVEGLEWSDKTFIVAMQWHPEIPPTTMAFFTRFVTEARRYRERAQGSHGQ